MGCYRVFLFFFWKHVNAFKCLFCEIACLLDKNCAVRLPKSTQVATQHMYLSTAIRCWLRSALRRKMDDNPGSSAYLQIILLPLLKLIAHDVSLSVSVKNIFYQNCLLCGKNALNFQCTLYHAWMEKVCKLNLPPLRKRLNTEASIDPFAVLKKSRG